MVQISYTNIGDKYQQPSPTGVGEEYFLHEKMRKKRKFISPAGQLSGPCKTLSLKRTEQQMWKTMMAAWQKKKKTR